LTFSYNVKRGLFIKNADRINIIPNSRWIWGDGESDIERFSLSESIFRGNPTKSVGPDGCVSTVQSKVRC